MIIPELETKGPCHKCKSKGKVRYDDDLYECRDCSGTGYLLELTEAGMDLVDFLERRLLISTEGNRISITIDRHGVSKAF